MINEEDMNLESCGYVFLRVGQIEAELDRCGYIKEYMPQSRYENIKGLPLHKYGGGPFCKFRIARGVHKSGVYILKKNDVPVYVGQCFNLYKRWSSNGYGGISPRNCFKGGQETNCRINNLICLELQNGASFELYFHELSPEKFRLNEVEIMLITNLRPDWNRTF